MNQFEKQLLQLAYENYQKNGTSYTEFQPRNSEEAIYCSDAVEYLEESGHLISRINNLAHGSISLLNHDSLICYELTEKGLEYAKSNIKQ